MEQWNDENRLPLTAEVQVSFQVCRPSGICGVENGNETGFSPNTLVFPCQYYSSNAQNMSFIYHQWYIILASGRIIKWNFLPAFFPFEMMVMECHVGALIELIFCKIG